jgi:hypothetical protein
LSGVFVRFSCAASTMVQVSSCALTQWAFIHKSNTKRQ